MARSRVVAVLSQKGGAGKSTLVMQLAGGLAKVGKKVAVGDLDPQETALRWAESAPAEQPFPARVQSLAAAGDLPAAIRGCGKGCEVLLLDCPPSIESPATLAALQVADVALIPVVPSPTDLWSTRAVEKLVLHVQAGRKGLKARLVPNRVVRTNLAWDVLEVMRDFALPVLGAALSQRNAYAQSAVIGGSVYQLGRAGAEAAREVNMLVAEVLKLTGER
ncbi:MAG TPA: AAA family ATPase [Zoogloea sp.]|uniref:AAA family ATPase n=1 Tax=Zoogloea sp. TaxID=49181 RepID=UPI002D1AFA7C|nr:AAA family ATPase [Zoogloea sp.]HMV18742.1 AAA family ATPase [Rhodocyclaceae bacterium]HMV63516.1 AAA family ATPase [Rhodocyclaceae bacterium]HMW52112.1 AAA family ATPase [Rhodocyclaceae bacterium]HMY48426.1 AAA family ATPase [Rhodocyclaceae bacterium]HMZ75932.1 AAA family ATPase [Rhodocyclaceae bacterium]